MILRQSLAPHRGSLPKLRPGRNAFTLTDLLVVVGLLAILALLPLPIFARAKEKSARTQCLSNLRQFGLAMQLYAADFRTKFPARTSGIYAWDIPVTFADQLLQRGMQRHTLYDPGFPEQDNNTLWDFSAYRVTGYALTLPGGGLFKTNENTSTIPRAITNEGIIYPPARPSERPLLACATISQGSNTVDRDRNHYTGIYLGWGPSRAAHMNGILPSGGNLGMLDASVRWVTFSGMIPRSTSLTFWW